MLTWLRKHPYEACATFIFVLGSLGIIWAAMSDLPEELEMTQPASVQYEATSATTIRLPAKQAAKAVTPLTASLNEEDLAILFYREPGKTRPTYNQFLAADTLAKRNGYNK